MMAEIRKITEYIVNKAKEEAKLTRENAIKECDAVISAAKKDADTLKKDILTKAYSEAADIERRAYSALSQKKARLILELKNQVIENVISTAKNSITEMPDNEYCSFLTGILKKNATGNPGNAVFNERDIRRMSAQLKKALRVANLTLETQPADISGGFILKYGSVLINCSLEAIFRDRQEEFTDCVSRAVLG